MISTERASCESTSAARPSANQRGRVAPVAAAALPPRSIKFAPRQVNFQRKPGDPREVETPVEPIIGPQPLSGQTDFAKSPCAAMAEKPLGQLGINIGMPAGDFPADPASACWNQVNQTSGPLVGWRLWQTFVYDWDATCLCHRPLYFEEVNLERYGYGCCETLQPLASAAHFFCTIPVLPYCIAAECPGECVYTLGHYRPGSCPPRRCHWPPFDPLAAAAEGGVWTGMVFLIP